MSFNKEEWQRKEDAEERRSNIFSAFLVFSGIAIFVWLFMEGML